jgi:hypothetical protein
MLFLTHALPELYQNIFYRPCFYSVGIAVMYILFYLNDLRSMNIYKQKIFYFKITTINLTDLNLGLVELQKKNKNCVLNYVLTNLFLSLFSLRIGPDDYILGLRKEENKMVGHHMSTN